MPKHRKQAERCKPVFALKTSKKPASKKKEDLTPIIASLNDVIKMKIEKYRIHFRLINYIYSM